ncbi:dTMP kinase [Candidatus Pacearchaeota archaeon]|nr:dTMP kinase [Candidatus Pacearchaeota archaeon]
MEKRGKLIVIEGSDGSGKKTQTDLLVERAQKEGYKICTLSFPQYDKFFGKEVRAYLNGKYGKLNEVHPKLASMLYALDRLSVKDELIEKLNQGYSIVLNRYLESNIGHQASKFEGEEREKFIRWLYELEIKQLGLPESDMVLYLDLPLDFAQKAMDKAGREKDIHESDFDYLLKVENTYKEIARENQKWVIIPCIKEEKRISVADLHEEVWKIVQPYLTR